MTDDTTPAGEPQPQPHTPTPQELVSTMSGQGKTFEEILAELKKRGIKLGGMKS